LSSTCSRRPGSISTARVAGWRSVTTRDVLADQPREQALHAADPLAEIDRARLDHLAPGELEELLGEARRAQGRRFDLLGVARRLGVERLVAQGPGVADDHREQVVEVVRDAAREPAHALEPLGPRAPLLQPLGGIHVVQLLGDADHRAARIAHRRERHLDRTLLGREQRHPALAPRGASPGCEAERAPLGGGARVDPVAVLARGGPHAGDALHDLAERLVDREQHAVVVEDRRRLWRGGEEGLQPRGRIAQLAQGLGEGGPRRAAVVGEPAHHQRRERQQQHEELPEELAVELAGARGRERAAREHGAARDDQAEDEARHRRPGGAEVERRSHEEREDRERQRHQRALRRDLREEEPAHHAERHQQEDHRARPLLAAQRGPLARQSDQRQRAEHDHAHRVGGDPVEHRVAEHLVEQDHLGRRGRQRDDRGGPDGGQRQGGHVAQPVDAGPAREPAQQHARQQRLDRHQDGVDEVDLRRGQRAEDGLHRELEPELQQEDPRPLLPGGPRLQRQPEPAGEPEGDHRADGGLEDGQRGRADQGVAEEQGGDLPHRESALAGRGFLDHPQRYRRGRGFPTARNVYTRPRPPAPLQGYARPSK
jgi:hypothetical protein